MPLLTVAGLKDGHAFDWLSAPAISLSFPRPIISLPDNELTGGFPEHTGLGTDLRHQFVPGFDERRGSFLLKLSSQRINVDTGVSEPRQHLFTVAATSG